MDDELRSLLEKEFHSLNNWLNKITTLSGLAKYRLEEKGFDLEKMDEEKKNFISMLKDIENYALSMGKVIKELRKDIKSR